MHILTAWRLLTASSEALSEAEQTSSTPAAFWVIVGLAAFGILVMFIQNFVLKKEEDYK